MNGPARTYDWPSLIVDEWTATRGTMHMWVQIVGKIRMAHMPLLNHWFHVVTQELLSRRFGDLTIAGDQSWSDLDVSLGRSHLW